MLVFCFEVFSLEGGGGGGMEGRGGGTSIHQLIPLTYVSEKHSLEIDLNFAYAQKHSLHQSVN